MTRVKKAYGSYRVAMHYPFFTVWWVLVFLMLVSAAILMSPVVMATENAAMSDEELAKKECGSCHYYLSKEYLPAFSWKKIIDNLDDHFGEDASIDEETRKRILSYMVGTRSTEIPMRVTETGWWKNAHGSSWKSLGAENNVNVSNCANCHRPDN